MCLHRTEPQAVGRIQARSDGLFYIEREWDGCDLACRRIDAADAALVGIDDRRAVRREGVAREQVAGVSRLLVVALGRVCEPAIFPGTEITQPEPAVSPITRRVGEERPIGRQRRTHGAALRAGQGVFAAVAQVETHDLPQRQPHVVVETAVLARVVQVASFRRVDRAKRVRAIARGGVGTCLGLGDLHAASAIDVVRPQLEGSQSPLGARGDYVRPVGCPRGRCELDVTLVRGQLAGFAAIGVCDPHVLAAVAVADKSDSHAVRRELRLRVERHAAGDAAGGAAFDGKDIQVSDRFHDDGGAVGRNVQRQPGHGVGLEGDFARPFERQLPGRCDQRCRQR